MMAPQEICLLGVDLALTFTDFTMNRRRFLTASVSALTLVAAPAARAEILQGRSAKMHGQRDRNMWLAVQRLAGVRLAKPGDLVQIIFFIDLNCPACAELWQWFDTPKRRELASRWIPVAYMDKTSAGRAIAFLGASDPYAALLQNYSNFDYENRRGNLAEAPQPSLQEQSAIRRNTRFWRSSLFGSTPLILYRNNDGTYWQLLGLFPEPEMSGYLTKLAPPRLDAY